MRRDLWAWGLQLLALAAYYFLQVHPLLAPGGAPFFGARSHANDYKHIYLGSVLLFEGLSPYSGENMLTAAGAYSGTVDARFRTILPYVYLPFTGLALRPLTILPFPQSVAAFQTVNHLMLLGSVIALCVAMISSRRDRLLASAGAIAALAISNPVFRQVNAGQLNILLVGVYAGVWIALARGAHPCVAGSIAAFGALLKLSPGILLLWFLFTRRFREAAWMLGAMTLFTVGSVALFGLPRHLEFLPVLGQMGFGKSTWAEYGNTFWRDEYNLSVNALLHRAFVDRPSSGITPIASIGEGAANLLTMLFALGVLGVACWVWSLRGAASASYATAIIVSLLLPSIFWDHYLVQLSVPVLLLTIAAVGERRFGMAAVIVCLFLLLGVPQQIGAPEWNSGLGILWGSAKLLPVLILGVIAATTAVVSHKPVVFFKS